MNIKPGSLIVALALMAAQSSFGQTLFTYGKYPVTKSEFLTAFNKNNVGGTRDEKAFRNYLELYTRYKLKVRAAYDQKLDTLSTQKAELENFRTQVAGNYLVDDEAIQTLVDQAFERSQKDIHLAHIFIHFNSPTDTADAYKQATAAYKELQSGKDFGAVAGAYSNDPNVGINKGDIGYITVFTLPYNLENLAYSLKPGSFSKPLKGKQGYHIFKNLGERKAIGNISVAQILLTYPPQATPEQKSKIQFTIDSIYAAAATGASFDSLALKYSNDNQSYQAGGQIPEFGVGRYEPFFEGKAFSLTRNGEVTKPFVTSYGYHILKRISATPVPSTKTPAYMADLKQRVASDMRMQEASKSMMQKILVRIGYKRAPFNKGHLWPYADSVLKNANLPQYADLNPKTVLFFFDKRKYTLNDWKNYLQAIRNVGDLVNGKSKEELLQSYVEASAEQYYRSNLERYNNAFAHQLDEFKNGNLLFECMQRNVWTKANDDTAGLRKYYTNNYNRYWWQPGADAVFFSGSDQKTIGELYKKIDSDRTNWRSIAKEYENIVQADSGRFEYDQFPISGVDKLGEGFVTAPVKNATDNSYTFLYLIKKHNTKDPRNFEDARGFALNDYQNYLEEEWIISLKKKYPVKVNQSVLQSLWK
ncbi:foldase protein PrsA [Pinibacter soli]|uniref:Peptidylprolyl isomerase n=1 Tax=Pinibacter soli TaxID=3044211 RepID=A0ABT6R995_9BACT|nr:peptidylprolyl isomerase [Pinibacter soli]MDI3318996.1 peptidylprolyl isomerase [Pinibacter soli]